MPVVCVVSTDSESSRLEEFSNRVSSDKKKVTKGIIWGSTEFENVNLLLCYPCGGKLQT